METTEDGGADHAVVAGDVDFGCECHVFLATKRHEESGCIWLRYNEALLIDLVEEVAFYLDPW